MNKEARTFCTDRQTTDDLNLLGKYRAESIFSLYNRTKTKGGEQLLEHFFQHPLSKAAAIEDRQRCIKELTGHSLVFPLDNKDFQPLEHYMTSFPAVSKGSLFFEIIKRNAQSLLGIQEEQMHVNQLLFYSLSALRRLLDWFKGTLASIDSEYLKKIANRFLPLLENSQLDLSGSDSIPVKLTVLQQFKYESFLRGTMHGEVMALLQHCYELDVFLGVAQILEEKKYCFPIINQGQQAVFKLTGAYHPGLKKAVGNNVQMDSNQNLLFLTGANMAGKSTVMKTIGICFYLAHIGFPVPAKEMETAIYDGFYTSINLPDNISKGYSHFYAEVLRVKDVAREVAAGKKLLIIFDELFKGTNVKDAFDATLSVAKALLDYKQSLFVLSTHIVEVGASLQQEATGIQYLFMPSVLEGNSTRYTYVLQEGISDDRHGMAIIRQEGIFDLFSLQKEHNS